MESKILQRQLSKIIIKLNPQLVIIGQSLGLGTSTSKEAKEYFSDMLRHRIKFKYGGNQDDNAIELAFSKKKIEERKDWLTSWMEDRKRRQLMKLSDVSCEFC